MVVLYAVAAHSLKEKKETKKATAMPNIVVVANSWDRELAYLDGATIADDCIEKGADVLKNVSFTLEKGKTLALVKRPAAL